MARLNPLQIFIVPFIFFVALPVAICAGITTILAFLVLFLRLFLAYFDVGMETLRIVLLGNTVQTRYMASQQLAPSSSSASLTAASCFPPASPKGKYNKRRKRGRSVGTHNGGDTTLTSSHKASLDCLALTPSIGLDRDFEGVGGWRLDNVDADAGVVGDEQWYKLNSRLETPFRHHHRSQSGGILLSGSGEFGTLERRMDSGTRTATHSPERLRMTSLFNNTGSRTPPNGKVSMWTKADGDGHFALYDGKSLEKAIAEV